MSSTLAELKKQAAQLSEAERAELALSLVERGEVQLIPGDEVFARLRRRLG
ncbi:MAG: hypothetical protein ACREV2_00570 [Burkholderiales bacterium]